jgi:hypothetical protein
VNSVESDRPGLVPLLVARLRYLEINTIAELEEVLRAERESMLSFVQHYFATATLSEGNFEAGVSVLYLCHWLAARRGDRVQLARYLETGQLQAGDRAKCLDAFEAAAAAVVA